MKLEVGPNGMPVDVDDIEPQVVRPEALFADSGQGASVFVSELNEGPSLPEDALASIERMEASFDAYRVQAGPRMTRVHGVEAFYQALESAHREVPTHIVDSQNYRALQSALGPIDALVDGLSEKIEVDRLDEILVDHVNTLLKQLQSDVFYNGARRNSRDASTGTYHYPRYYRNARLHAFRVACLLSKKIRPEPFHQANLQERMASLQSEIETESTLEVSMDFEAGRLKDVGEQMRYHNESQTPSDILYLDAPTIEVGARLMRVNRHVSQTYELLRLLEAQTHVALPTRQDLDQAEARFSSMRGNERHVDAELALALEWRDLAESIMRYVEGFREEGETGTTPHHREFAGIESDGNVPGAAWLEGLRARLGGLIRFPDDLEAFVVAAGEMREQCARAIQQIESFKANMESFITSARQHLETIRSTHAKPLERFAALGLTTEPEIESSRDLGPALDPSYRTALGRFAHHPLTQGIHYVAALASALGPVGIFQPTPTTPTDAGVEMAYVMPADAPSITEEAPTVPSIDVTTSTLTLISGESTWDTVNNTFTTAVQAEGFEAPQGFRLGVSVPAATNAALAAHHDAVVADIDTSASYQGVRDVIASWGGSLENSGYGLVVEYADSQLGDDATVGQFLEVTGDKFGEAIEDKLARSIGSMDMDAETQEAVQDSIADAIQSELSNPSKPPKSEAYYREIHDMPEADIPDVTADLIPDEPIEEVTPFKATIRERLKGWWNKLMA